MFFRGENEGKRPCHRPVAGLKASQDRPDGEDASVTVRRGDRGRKTPFSGGRPRLSGIMPWPQETCGKAGYGHYEEGPDSCNNRPSPAAAEAFSAPVQLPGAGLRKPQTGTAVPSAGLTSMLPPGLPHRRGNRPRPQPS